MAPFFVYLFSFSIYAAAAYYLCPARYRVRFVLPVLNILFIYVLVHDLHQLIPLIFFILLGYAAIRAVAHLRHKGLFLFFLSLIVIVFIYFKKYTFIPPSCFIQWPYTVLGMSYILFRMIQLLVDVYQGQIKEKVPFIGFLNFSCNFFTFLSGPIQSYQEYSKQEMIVHEETPDQKELFNRFLKLINGFINGYIRVSIISAFCFSLQGEHVSWLKYSFGSASWLMVCRSYMTATILYTLYLYFNFSGYMSIVIGIGEAFGFKLPENFNKPFVSHSFLDLWSRWHMTLSNWFKVYIFNPLIKFLLYRWPSPRLVAYQGVIAYFITFMLMGFWHGTTTVFLIYGLFLGSGAALNKLFDVQMRKNCRTAYKRMTDHQIAGLIGGALTFSYLSMGLTSFWFDYNNLGALMGKIHIIGFLAVLGSGAMCWSLLLIAGKILQRWLIEVSNNSYGVILVRSLKVLMVLIFLMICYFRI